MPFLPLPLPLTPSPSHTLSPPPLLPQNRPRAEDILIAGSPIGLPARSTSRRRPAQPRRAPFFSTAFRTPIFSLRGLFTLHCPVLYATCATSPAINATLSVPM